MVLMMFSVTLLALTIQFIAATPMSMECVSICKDYRDSSYKSNVCQAALNIMPKPDVHNACIRGKMLGFEHSCMSSCMNAKDTGRYSKNSQDACKSLAKKPLPNHQLPWCRRGYDSTYDKVQGMIDDILVQVSDETKHDQSIDSEILNQIQDSDESDIKNLNRIQMSEQGDIKLEEEIRSLMDGEATGSSALATEVIHVTNIDDFSINDREIDDFQYNINNSIEIVDNVSTQNIQNTHDINSDEADTPPSIYGVDYDEKELQNKQVYDSSNKIVEYGNEVKQRIEIIDNSDEQVLYNGIDEVNEPTDPPLLNSNKFELEYEEDEWIPMTDRVS